MQRFMFQIAVCLTLAAMLQCSPHVSNSTNEASCDVLQEYNLLTCYMIDDLSIDVVFDALQDTINWTEVALAITWSDVDAFPTEIFQNATLTKLIFSFNATMDNVPNKILKEILSPLKYLEFTNVNGIISISSADFEQLPFRTDLQELILQIPGLRNIEGSSFQQLTQLKALTVTNSQIQYLPNDILHGLSSLEELTITYSPITTIPNNFFIEQSHVKNVWLGQNKIEFIEEGTLDGLDNVQMLSVPGK